MQKQDYRKRYYSKNMEDRKPVLDAIACLFSPYEGVLVSEPQISSMSTHVKNYTCINSGATIYKTGYKCWEKKKLEMCAWWEVTVFLFSFGRVMVV
jgi:hypothetical protein